MALQDRPTKLPEWASGAAVGDVVEPSGSRKGSGWTTVGGVPEIPPYEWFNWLALYTYQWTKHLSERIFTGDKITLTDSAANEDLTGILIDPTDYRSFELKLSVNVDATTPRYALITFTANWNGAAWEARQDEISDVYSEVTLNVTAAGQVQYSSPAWAGFVGADATWECRRIPA